jgi:hypothetical protein
MLTHSSLRVVVTVMAVITTLFLVGCGIDNPTTSYQGYLTTSSTNARVPDGAYPVTYRFFTSASGGSAVYTESGTLEVENGLFNTSFGGANLPTDVTAQELYLEVEIDGEVLSPRQRLQGAPFAWTLVSGSLIGASEEITRTLVGIDNAGAGLLVGNSLSGTGGGSGIIGSTFSENANAAGVVGVSQAGAYGGRFSTESYRGLRTDTNNTSFYTAAFFGGIGIYVEGNCTGCRSAEVAQNVGSEAIAIGDFVAVEGVATNEAGYPVLQVRRADAPSDVLVGVSVGTASEAVKPDASSPDRVIGNTPAGGYLTVGVSGLFQAKLADGAEVAIGDYLTAGTDGAMVLASRGDSGNSPARVMSAPDANGMVWVMLGGQ